MKGTLNTWMNSLGEVRLYGIWHWLHGRLTTPGLQVTQHSPQP